MIQIKCKRDDISLYIVSAGKYNADAGATMGVLPYKLWHDKVKFDENHCLRMNLNCLLIKTPEKNILVDVGIGDFLTDRLKKIYAPSTSTLCDEIKEIGIKPADIDAVVLTHLHFDHAGGLIDSEGKALFINARYFIQQDEWDIAQNPDILNSAAYSLKAQYQMLSDSRKIELIDGDYELYEGVYLHKVAGHCPGMQIVKIKDEGEVVYYAGDLFPLRFHLSSSVTSAYDICRRAVCNTKEMIKKELDSSGGKLILSHEMDEPIVVFKECEI
jgi:glyoxylase-like metal-dependent hydrolase (beta-lactamase superfamily II)